MDSQLRFSLGNRLRQTNLVLFVLTAILLTARAEASASRVVKGQKSRAPASVETQPSAVKAPSPSALKAVDPNAAVEIRGQARTLSMMLVLKNGKDSINFIKVRKDYHPEISRTEY